MSRAGAPRWLSPNRLAYLLTGVIACLSLVPGSLLADGPDDNHPDRVRQVPPAGIEISPQVRDELLHAAKQLESELGQWRRETEAAELAQLWPDVAIYARAVRMAVVENQIYREQEIEVARALLRTGNERLASLRAGQSPWTQQTGLVFRGFESQLDGTAQPCAIEVPSAYQSNRLNPWPLDLWFHGRGERLGELQFLNQQRVGVFHPPTAFVVHPYGRYSNANKFAGEVDALESLQAAKRFYAIDSERIAVRGFSMGGASTWQLAVHFPGEWAVANPGAGFSETPDFLQTFQQETLTPYWWEKRLWHWYDATDWSGNLRHCPTIAYSGELDRQKQAADIMARAMVNEGLDLIHLIGPQTEHRYEPATAEEVERLVRTLSAQGRESVPQRIEFTTYTLKYPGMAWFTVTGMGEHWERARVDARWTEDEVAVQVENVTAFEFDFATGQSPFRLVPGVRIRYREDDQWKETRLAPSDLLLNQEGRLPSDRSWKIAFCRGEHGWRVGKPELELRKQPGLQGPIDDAFMGPFLFVKPTGDSPHEAAAKWAAAEMERAIREWRRHFRGDVRIKNDVDVTAEDHERFHLVLWGDSHSNQVWQSLGDRLPIALAEGDWKVGDQSFDGASHAPVFVYPNPQSPGRYVVANSGFTFREFAYLNNARQVAMLPDWAMIDLREPPGYVWPGKIAAADFFDERWQVRLPIPEPRRVDPPPIVDFSQPVALEPVTTPLER